MYTDGSHDACGDQLSQEHDGQELPIAFLSHTFADTQPKWSTTEQEGYDIYYAVTKWNNYLQGSDIVVSNNHKPLQKFLDGKNANNKVNRWSLELTIYNITFEWILGGCNKASDYLLWLVDIKETPVISTSSINMLVTSTPDGPATHTHSKTHDLTNPTLPTDGKSALSADKVNAPPPLMEDDRDTLWLMQRINPFYKHNSKWLLSGIAPWHEVDTFMHIKGLLYKYVYVMDSNENSWH